MKRLLLCLVICCGAGSSFSQHLPDSAQELLDVRFPNWDFLTFGVPKGVDSSLCYIRPDARNILSCFLNADAFPDYAVALEALHDSVWFEYFVGLIAHGDSYEVFVADSIAYDGDMQMTIARAHSSIAYFGDDGNAITSYGQLALDKQTITFPTDCIVLCSIVESSIEASYVFIEGKFVMFQSAD